MEAVAKHVFKSTQDDDLGFAKGSIVNVLDMDQDKNWFKAEQNGREGWVPRTYIELKPHNWFHGKITRKQAETILMDQRGEGIFLVRESETSPVVGEKKDHYESVFIVGDFSLSVRFGGQVQHFKIFRDTERQYFLWSKKFDSINLLIDHHRSNSVSRSQDIVLKDIDSMPTVQALYDFVGQEEGEVSFSRGDWITVLDSSNENWWEGKINGDIGLFPATYVSKNNS